MDTKSDQCSTNSKERLRKNEIIAYQALLQEYNITFRELIQHCPAEKRKVKMARRIARKMADDPLAEQHFESFKNAEKQHFFAKRTLISPQYVIALALLYYHNMTHLVQFIEN